ncbi:MAG: HEAT repeat domain-containing protein [Bacillota bacterium]
MLKLINTFIFILLASIGALLFILTAFHLRIYIKNKKYQRLKNKWELILLKFLSDEISLDEAAEGFGNDYKHIWDFTQTYLDNLEGNDYIKLKNLLQAIGFNEYYYNKLKKGSDKDKIKAAVILGKIKDERAIPELREMLESDSSLKIKIAGQAIAQIGETAFIYDVVKAFLSKTYITYEGISQILIIYGEDICPSLIQIIEDWLEDNRDIEEEFQTSPYQPIALFVELLGHNSYKVSIPILERLLREINNEELIIQVFKALSRIKEPVEINLTQFINHENWVIRSQAIRYLYKNWNPGYSKQLKARLSDENWWVSFYAGMALYHNKFKDYLEKIATSDKPGANISNYILEAGGQFEHF